MRGAGRQRGAGPGMILLIPARDLGLGSLHGVRKSRLASIARTTMKARATSAPRRTSVSLMSAVAAIFLAILHAVHVAGTSDPPKPDIALTTEFPKANFHSVLYAMWEPDHATVSPDESSVALTLDQRSGCGIKSLAKYSHGFFSASIKLPGNYSAGVVTTFYMSNNQEYPHNHDEFDFEFLGTIPGEPYTIQTNAYGNGVTAIGREQRFRLWFDPTTDFHDYSFLWTANHTVFFIDNIPIWEYPNMVDTPGYTYASKEMSLFSTIWDASRWATDGGMYQVDYSYQPFVATYTNFIMNGCSEISSSNLTPDGCPLVFDFSIPPGLNKAQRHAMHWVHSNHRFYSYCTDYQRYPDLFSIPECEEERSRDLSHSKPAPGEHQSTFLHIPVQSEFLIHP